ncbi:MAG: hypothetical protein ACC661_00595 [Verrucomicrobiales bacterium]
MNQPGQGGTNHGKMTDSEVIECRVAPWYFRRMGLIILMLAGCGFWFLYDGKVGWPRGNHRADLYDAFEAGNEGVTWEETLTRLRETAAGKKLPLDTYQENASDPRLDELRKAYDAALGSGSESWMSFSAEQRISEHRSERHPQSAIDGQFHWSIGAFTLGGVVLVLLLVNTPKILRGDHESFTPPGGARVLFADVFRVDKRKWDNKGLAYASYRDEKGRVKKAVIDDLKFKGADRILDRLLESFEGELVERAPMEEEDEEDAAEAEPESGALEPPRGGDNPEGDQR